MRPPWDGRMRFASRRPRVSRAVHHAGPRATSLILLPAAHPCQGAETQPPGQAIQMTGPPADDETAAGTTRSARSACLRHDARPGSVPTAELDCRAKPLDRATGPTFEPPPESVRNLPPTRLPRYVSGHAGQVGRGTLGPVLILIDNRPGSASTADIPATDLTPSPTSWPKGLSSAPQAGTTYAGLAAGKTRVRCRAPLGPR